MKKILLKISFYFQQALSFFKEKPWVIPGILIILLSFYWILVKPPQNFPTKTLISIEEGESLSKISNKFQDLKIIKHPVFFQSLVILLDGEKGAMAGDYYFNKKINALKVAQKIINGEFGLTPVSVTIFEGMTLEDMSMVFDKEFPNFNKKEFLEISQGQEGYLFPDTYLFLPNVKAKDIIKQMTDNFVNKIQSIEEEISKSDKTLKDIIIMASILEKEARTKETKEIISGILWKRISIGMPLQVDAVFPYINGKNTFQLSLADLKIDSPYNTYKYPGLPIGPIANPSLESILAAINPVESPYFFYLSDKNGKMYYGVDFKQHLINKKLYLNN